MSPGDPLPIGIAGTEGLGHPQEDFWKILLPQLLCNLADFLVCGLRPWDSCLSSWGPSDLTQYCGWQGTKGTYGALPALSPQDVMPALE